jgi:hypothetical protein
VVSTERGEWEEAVLSDIWVVASTSGVLLLSRMTVDSENTLTVPKA